MFQFATKLSLPFPQARLRQAPAAAHDACASAGITLLADATTSRIDMPQFRIDTPQRALAAIAVAAPGTRGTIALRFDVYHAQVMGGDAAGELLRCLPQVGHVQIADHSGRHEPGSGGVDWAAVRAVLATGGYAGWVGCEYRPFGDTLAGLGWRGAWTEDGRRASGAASVPASGQQGEKT